METERQSRAKRPTSRISGTYGHPVHPFLVTIPIGAWTASFIFDVASFFTEGAQFLVRGAYWLLAIGWISAAVAALFGLLDLFGIHRRTRAFRTGLVHAGLNVIVLLLFGISFLLRRLYLDAERVPGELIVLSGAALALLAASGWIGGRLVYRYGVRVVDEKTQAQGFEILPGERGFTPSPKEA